MNAYDSAFYHLDIISILPTYDSNIANTKTITAISAFYFSDNGFLPKSTKPARTLATKACIITVEAAIKVQPITRPNSIIVQDPPTCFNITNQRTFAPNTSRPG